MEWEKKGVPFRSHVYVPEIHPLTGVPFHEREDEAHVFKVCDHVCKHKYMYMTLPYTMCK